MRKCVSNGAGKTWLLLGLSAVATGLGVGLHAQEQAAAPKEPLVFEVAAIKPTPADERRGIVHQLPGNQGYEAIGAPLRMIMTVAYTVTDRQISGGPDWLNTDR